MNTKKNFVAVLLAAPLASPALAGCADPSTLTGSICNEFVDTWEQGGDDLYVTFHSYHLRSAYTKEKIDSFEENAWGLGYGRSRYDEQGNWHSLYAMGFRDSHAKFEPLAGYGYQWMWGERDGFHAGLGYTVVVTSRADLGHYIPFPGILPIGSINYRRNALNMAYVPGGKGNGNVLFFWGRFGF